MDWVKKRNHFSPNLALLCVCMLVLLFGCQPQVNTQTEVEGAGSKSASIQYSRPVIEGPVLVYQGEYETSDQIEVEPLVDTQLVLLQEDVQFKTEQIIDGLQYELSIYKVEDILIFSAAQPVTNAFSDEKAEIFIFDHLIPGTYQSNLDSEEPVAILLLQLESQAFSACVEETPIFRIQVSGGNAVRVMFVPLYHRYSGVLNVSNASGEREYTKPVSAMMPVEGVAGIEGLYYPWYQ